jgi:4-amino-4-deoxy-L-arabinose transferase-like glycosyltransferase
MAKKYAKPTHRPQPSSKPAPRPATTTPAAPPPDWRALADRYARPTLWGLLALAFLLRVLHLSDLTLWVDEFVHVLRARDVVDGSGPLFSDDNNGILLTIILLPFFSAFGASAFWARFPSVLFGVGIVYLVYQLGTRLFNRYVGLLSAFSATISLYLVFWSRMARNYAIFGFFFLLLGLIFLAAFERASQREGAGFFEKNGISRKNLLLLPLVALAALLSHQLAFFFVFAVAAYSTALAIGKIARAESDRWRNKYLWLSALSLPALLVALVPPFAGLAKNLLATLSLSRIENWGLPRWDRIAGWWSANPYGSFDIYNGVLRYDLTLLYFPALAGLVAAFWLRRRAAIWLLSSALLPFLLMSFIYREPALPRYFIYVFPYFLIAAAAFFYFLWKWLTEKALPDLPNSARYALLAMPFVLAAASVRWSELTNLVLARQLEGHVVDMNIAQYNFTNWKQPAQFVAARRQPGDVLLATVPTAAAYYLDDASVLPFRQARYDTQSKKYQLNAPDPSGKFGAGSFEDLVSTVQRAPRGWLLADYYLENVFTDDRARLFVYQNLTFYPEASPDGSVMLFGWDNTKPRPTDQNMVLEVGKSPSKYQSHEQMLVLPDSLLQYPKVEMTFRARGLNLEKEGLVVLNGENAVYLPTNQGRDIETLRVTFPSNLLRRGRNTVQAVYEGNPARDPYPGFCLYYLAFRGTQ